MENNPQPYYYSLPAGEESIQSTGLDPSVLQSSDWFWGSVPVSPGSFPPTSFNPYAIPPYTDRPPFPNQQSSRSSSSREIPKVAIPRTAGVSGQSQRRRSARACEPCRQRKIKCDGNKPACKQCVEHNVSCSYLDAKRVRDQKQLGVLAKKVQRYEKLLEGIELEVEGALARRIRKSLQGSEASSADDDASDSGDETSSIGSLDEIDLIDEDLNRDEKSIATGFFGKNSEIYWMQRLEDEIEGRSQGLDDSGMAPDQATSMQEQKHDVPSTTVSYHLDDLQLPLMDCVDAYALPPKELADQFFNVFMESVHPAFMVLRKSIFTAQYRQFFSQPSNPPRRWLAILNMIFAIGCRYQHLVDHAGGGDLDDVLYLNRARKLALSGNVLFEHADLQQIQVEFLVALYLLSMGQVNRSFKFSSMALRSALSLGINLRLVDGRTHYTSKEARSRLWWSIYLLEHQLTSVTGRVSCVNENLSSTPLPVPFEEDAFGRPEVLCLFQDSSMRESHLKLTLLQTEEEARSSAEWLLTCEPTSSLFFYCLVDLTSITQAVMNKVYSIQALREPSGRIHHRIRKYSKTLDTWLSKLPQAFRFTESHSERFHAPAADDPFMQERIRLAFNFYSSKITLCRPCVTRTNLKGSSSQSAKTSHSELRNEMALSCLRSACRLTSILPEEPDIHWLARVSPWWTILHHLMQANTALLLGLSCWSITDLPKTSMPTNPSTPPIDTHTMLAACKKVTRWLHTMSYTNTAARRAFLFCDSFIRRIAPSLGLDLAGLPDGATLPSQNDSIWMMADGPEEMY
ncbi:fungal-specific transcription factor domain-containing protein [Aspergillus pseudonomiae]|uniref:Fungal-specific transcription factor domain-containing protein n=1 Tax=Aspergillus pseudonomiae TaxID=1506151 RepID=A0A5N7CXC4_9EURO|nr:fungal-specific transcription factor domain-containing protein [Aspergillus pseudonomiae]KAE8398243.1 fungal-specific transcription factor domain-containing protein [Aspergillus pseudonomiae]